MKSKNNILQRADVVGFTTGAIASVFDEYQFGAKLEILSGAPVVTLVVEHTADSGFTWVPLVSFELDTNGEVTTPDLGFDGTSVRARITNVTGTGQFYVSLWMK